MSTLVDQGHWDSAIRGQFQEIVVQIIRKVWREGPVSSLRG
jgi:hypothetical protein